MRTAPRAASISAAVALVLAAVWVFWPLALGGAATYVGTHGTSMQPRFHTGDLAILRSADTYSVGDVVAYYSESLDTIVMHRIVTMDGDRFVTQGDNNDWLDADHPSKSEVLGKLLVRVPHGGAALAALRSPGVLGLVGVAALALAGSATRPRSRHGARAASRPPARRALAFSAPIRGQARQVALVSGAVAVVAGIGGGVLLAMPSTQDDSTTIPVTQQGTFTYAGTAAAGTTYPDGVVSTGDTVWTKLATGLTVSFTNTVTGADRANLRGAMRLDVSIASADGWSSYLNSSPEVALANGSATATAPIDVSSATARLRQHYAEIGTPGASATLTVTPVVATTGTVRGVAFEAGSLDPLSFAVDDVSLRPSGDSAAGLTPSTRTDVTVDGIGPRQFTVFAVTIPIGVARFVASVVLAFALVVLAAASWIGRTARGDAADEFVVRHAARILPVAAFDPGPTVIDVSDAEALHKVAERFDTLVLHHAGDDEDVFAVRDVDATYRFVVPGGREARVRPPVPAPVRVREPDDLTAPLPIVVSAPLTSVSAGLWGRFA